MRTIRLQTKGFCTDLTGEVTRELIAIQVKLLRDLFGFFTPELFNALYQAYVLHFVFKE